MDPHVSDLVNLAIQGGLPVGLLVLELRQWRGVLERWLVAFQGADVVVTIRPAAPRDAPSAAPRPLAAVAP